MVCQSSHKIATYFIRLTVLERNFFNHKLDLFECQMCYIAYIYLYYLISSIDEILGMRK